MDTHWQYARRSAIHMDFALAENAGVKSRTLRRAFQKAGADVQALGRVAVTA
jgi:hypothetical protein